MQTLQRHTSPDGKLTLQVVKGDDGVIAVGFDEIGAWHMHPDLLASWLQVPEDSAVAKFLELVMADELPIIVSTDAGESFEPWVSDNLAATLDSYGRELCRLRYWSGREVVPSELGPPVGPRRSSDDR